MNIYVIQQDFNTSNASYHHEVEYVVHPQYFTENEFKIMCEEAYENSDGDVVDIMEYLCWKNGFKSINDYTCQAYQYE